MSSRVHLPEQSTAAASELPVVAAAPRTPVANEALTLSIAEYGIGMVIPPGGEFDGNLKIDCGVVIFGFFKGTLECEKGTVVIHEGGRFIGRLVAHRIIVAGTVGDVTQAAKDSALLIAVDELRIGATANVQAVLRSPSTEQAKGAKLNSSVIKSTLIGG